MSDGFHSPSAGPTTRWQQALRVVVMGWAFLLIVGLYPYTQDPAGPIKLWFTALSGFLALHFLVFGLAASKQALDGRNPAVVVMLAYLGVGLVSAAFSQFPRNSLEHLGETFFFVAIALAVVHSAQTWAALRPLLLTVLAALCLASLYGVVQWMGFDPFPWSQQDIEEYRGLPSTYANPNFAGHVIAPALAMLLVLGLAGRMPWLLLPAMLLAFHLYMTGMRGGPLALIAALLMVLVLGVARRKGYAPGRTLAALLVGLVLLAAVLVPLGLRHIAVSEQWFSADSSLTLRMNGYVGAGEMLRDAPLTGVGPGNYDRYAPAYWQPFEAEWYTLSGKRNFHVHNDLLEAAAEGGYPGAWVYLLLLGVVVFGGLQIAHRHGEPRIRALGWGLSAAGLTLLLDGQFGFPLQTPVAGGLFFLLLGIVGGLLSQGAVPSRRPLIYWALVAPVLALAFLGLGIEHRHFLGERAYQEALGAMGYLRESSDGPAAQAAREHARLRLEAATRYLAADPRPPERLGALLLESGDGAASAQHYEESLRRHPHQPRALEGLGQALLVVYDPGIDELSRGAQRSRALRAVLQALELTPRSPNAHFLRGEWALRQAQQFDQGTAPADEQYRNALSHYAAGRRYGYQSPGMVARAEALAWRGLGDTPKAFERIVSALEARPGDERAWRLFEELAAASAPAEYLTALGRVWQQVLAGEGAGAVVARVGQAYSSATKELAQRPSVARVIIEAALRRAPEELGLWINLADLAPDADTAAAWIRELAAQDLAPESAPGVIQEITTEAGEGAGAQHQLGRLYLEGGNPDRAVTLIEAAVARAEPEPRKQMLVDFSAALAATGEVERALEVAREAQRALPMRTLVEWNLARRLQEAGRTAEAQFAYQALLRRVPVGTAEHEAIQGELAALTSEKDGVTP